MNEKSQNFCLETLTAKCRVCLNTTDAFVSLHDKSIDLNLSNLHVIAKCTSIQLKMNLIFPDDICNVCLSRLKESYRFFNDCQKSEAILNELTDDDFFKTEPKIEMELDPDDIESASFLSDQIGSIQHDSEVILWRPVEKFLNGLQQLSSSTCPLCSREYKNKLGLRVHLHKTHSMPYKCKICHINFATRKQLVKHSQTHYKCKDCSNAYEQKVDLVNHMKKHGGDKPTEKNLQDCEECDTKFRNKNDYRSHMREKHDKFHCVVCSEKFDTYEEVTKHRFTHYNTAIECDYCKKLFIDKYHLYKHLQWIHPSEARNLRANDPENWQSIPLNEITAQTDDAVICETCSTTFDCRKNYWQHMRKVHDAVYTCDLCDGNFTTEKERNRHRIIAHCEDQKTCFICEKDFVKHYVYARHMREVHRKKIKFSNADELSEITGAATDEEENRDTPEIKSETRDLEFGEIPQRNGMLIMKLTKFPCKNCDRVLLSETSLLKHQKHHGGNSNENGNGKLSATSKHPCFNCDFVANNNTLLQKHVMESHTDENGYICCSKCPSKISKYRYFITHISSSHGNRQKFMCSICGLQLKGPSSLVQHTRRHNQDYKWQCEECPRKFLFEHELKKHKLTRHSDKQEITCSLCNKRFAIMRQLKMHMNCVHGDGSHECDVCAKTFNSRNKLTAHRVIHGPRKYQCTYCERCFPVKKHLQRHTYVHTGEKPCACDYCDQSFAQWTSRTLHMRRHHPIEYAARKAKQESGV